MQQEVMDEGLAYEPSIRSYDDLFPALPESTQVAQTTNNSMGKWNNKMRVGSSVITQVFRYVLCKNYILSPKIITVTF